MESSAEVSDRSALRYGGKTRVGVSNTSLGNYGNSLGQMTSFLLSLLYTYRYYTYVIHNEVDLSVPEFERFMCSPTYETLPALKSAGRMETGSVPPSCLRGYSLRIGRVTISFTVFP